MEKSLIIKLALGETPTEKEIIDELYEICDRVHSGCNNDCPVFELNGGKVVEPREGDFDGCHGFKNGRKMLNFIREKSRK
jgi:hypothetical protein